MHHSAQATRSSLLLRVRDTADEQAWREFVELYTPLVFGYCRRRGMQEADAADVAQEVMQTVARSVGNFHYQRDKGTFRAWLHTVTRTRLANYCKRQQRQPRGSGETAVLELLEAQPGPDSDDAWDQEFHQRLLDWACVRIRSEFQTATWEAFVRTAIEGQPPKLVAPSLGLSVGAVYIARSRVTARIREKIQEATEAAAFPPDGQQPTS